MKKKLLLFVLLLSFANIQAQPGYRPMLHNGRKWQIMLGDASICGYQMGYELRIFGDTIINGYHYYKSSSRSIFSSVQVAFCPPYYLDSIETPQVQYFREDTTTRKVYRYLPPASEELTYDFSLQVGDTFYFWNNTAYEIITSISYYPLSAMDSTRRFDFLGGAYWIEGYDCSEGAFGVPVISVSGSYYRTVCIIDSASTYSIPGWCISGILSLNDHSITPQNILQNTVASDRTLFINPDFQAKEDFFLEVVNLQGVSLHRSSVQRDQTEIKLPLLSPGVYIVSFYLSAQNSLQYKILVP